MARKLTSKNSKRIFFTFLPLFDSSCFSKYDILAKCFEANGLEK